MDEFRNLSLKESPETATNIQSSSPTTPIKVTHIFTTQTYTSSPASAIPHTSSPLDTQSLGHTCHITTPSLHPPPRPTPPPPPQVTSPPRSTFADQPKLEPPRIFSNCPHPGAFKPFPLIPSKTHPVERMDEEMPCSSSAVDGNLRTPVFHSNHPHISIPIFHQHSGPSGTLGDNKRKRLEVSSETTIKKRPKRPKKKEKKPTNATTTATKTGKTNPEPKKKVTVHPITQEKRPSTKYKVEVFRRQKSVDPSPPRK